MTLRTLALGVACAVQLATLAGPAVAQLRPTPLFGGTRAGSALPVPSGPRSADFIVAVVNSEPITNNEVRVRLLRYEQQLAQQGQPMPPRAQLTREVLERLILERAQLQLARETNVRADDALVDQAELNVARQNQIDVNELRRRLVADGFVISQFREDLRNQILLQRLRERELDTRARVTEADIDAYLREQQRSAADPSLVEINLAQILVAVPENAAPALVSQAEAKAKRLAERARTGEDFGRLVRENSDAQGAANGGVIGLRSADRYPPLFVEATRDLREGGVSEVVRSAAGFHLLKVIEKRQGAAPGLTVTQSRARHILLRADGRSTEAQSRDKLADFKRRIQAGQADFAQLARDNSQDASAREGGDLGWVAPGMFVPEFEDVMNGLAPGQIADPFASRFGMHLVQLLERRVVTLSQKEQREAARAVLRERKLDEAYAQWAQEVRGRAYVEFRDPPQ